MCYMGMMVFYITPSSTLSLGMLVARKGRFVMDVIHGIHNTELKCIMMRRFEVESTP